MVDTKRIRDLAAWLKTADYPSSWDFVGKAADELDTLYRTVETQAEKIEELKRDLRVQQHLVDVEHKTRIDMEESLQACRRARLGLARNVDAMRSERDTLRKTAEAQAAEISRLSIASWVSKKNMIEMACCECGRHTTYIASDNSIIVSGPCGECSHGAQVRTEQLEAERDALRDECKSLREDLAQTKAFGMPIVAHGRGAKFFMKAAKEIVERLRSPSGINSHWAIAADVVEPVLDDPQPVAQDACEVEEEPQIEVTGVCVNGKPLYDFLCELTGVSPQPALTIEAEGRVREIVAEMLRPTTKAGKADPVDGPIPGGMPDDMGGGGM